MASNACCAPKRRVYHILDATSLIFVLVLQGSILNYYIIRQYKSTVSPYFWFIADFGCLFVFAGTLTVSYQYLTNVRFSPTPGPFALSPKRISSRFPVSKLGIMPLSYVSWLIYSGILLGKVIVIVKADIPYHLKPHETFGPQLLQLTIASSGFIFLLLVEGHNWAPRGSPRHIFVTFVCGKTAIEILDTVSLLSLLHVHHQSCMSLAAQEAVRGLEVPIIVLCSCNFLLPALALYKLSLADVSVESLALPVAVLYNLLHLGVIDVPYLAVRLYLWSRYDHSTSVLVVKNIFGIVLALRGLSLDLQEMWRRKTDVTPQPMTASNGRLAGGGEGGDGLELQPVHPPGTTC